MLQKKATAMVSPSFGFKPTMQRRELPEMRAVAEAANSVVGRLRSLPMRVGTVSVTDTWTPERLSTTDALTFVVAPSRRPAWDAVTAVAVAKLSVRATVVFARLSSFAALTAAKSAAA